MYYDKLYFKNAKYEFCKMEQKIKINFFYESIKMHTTNNYRTQTEFFLN